MIDYLLLIIGLAILAIGGDNLVRGAVGLAENFRVPAFIIGLTVVSIGTTLPEVFVSVNAALDGVGGLAIGNAIGSCVANVLLVVGLMSAIRPTHCGERGLDRNALILTGITIVFMAMLAKGRLERLDGLLLLLALGLFLLLQLRAATRHRRAQAAAAGILHEEVGKVPHRPAAIAVMIGAGLAFLPVGAELVVRSASAIAARWGIGAEVIGLTVVAIGTSLPELAAGTLAAIRGRHAVALGNVVGANIFNVGLIMGVTAGLVPIPVPGRIVGLDMWVMLAAALLVAALAHLKAVIGRPLALAMLAAYVLYAGLSYAI
ncbi:MAG: calcium/sodium antiporter [Alphaproteobacteria bacterium]|nr:MAG: calcium/sodium antiporter [Alphaproteobacteria bacterium]